MSDAGDPTEPWAGDIEDLTITYPVQIPDQIMKPGATDGYIVIRREGAPDEVIPAVMFADDDGTGFGIVRSEASDDE